MAPEQLRGREIINAPTFSLRRNDDETLTGQAVRRKTSKDVLCAEGTFPFFLQPRDLNPSIPEDVERIILALSSK